MQQIEHDTLISERKPDRNVAMTFRATPEFAHDIEAAAARELLSVSAFVRRAVLQSLRLNAPDHL